MPPESRSLWHQGLIMRTMKIPPFPKRREISDINSLTNARLNQRFRLSEQAVALAGYVFYPTDEEARTSFTLALRSSSDPLKLNLKGMRRIQYRWLRAADVLHLYFDMVVGGHQRHRGGPSISKAVHLAAKNTRSIGTSKATFWSAWKAYRDVVPVVAAAVLILANARIVLTAEYFEAFRVHDDAEPITLDQLSPFHMIMLLPDLVLAVALYFEGLALTKINNRDDAGLDANTLWRIPENINVVPVPPPARKIRPVDKTILNARRAGNRGSRNSKRPDRSLSGPL
jgi:hypothetical protein